ncbi:MAG: hypothetical protein V4620_01685 [Bacteroidota bacterium]
MEAEKIQQEQLLEKEKKDEGKYEAALNLLFYEGQIAWQMNILFVALNVGIGTIIGDFLFDLNTHYKLLSVFSFAGIFINIAWLGTFKRNNKYYHFRMAQAREAEPKSWELLRARGYNFSKGHEIIIASEEIESKDKSHQLTSFEKRYSNKRAIEFAIWIFIIGFLLLCWCCLYFFFQNICK